MALPSAFRLTRREKASKIDVGRPIDCESPSALHPPMDTLRDRREITTEPCSRLGARCPSAPPTLSLPNTCDRAITFFTQRQKRPTHDSLVPSRCEVEVYICRALVRRTLSYSCTFRLGKASSSARYIVVLRSGVIRGRVKSLGCY